MYENNVLNLLTKTNCFSIFFPYYFPCSNIGQFLKQHVLSYLSAFAQAISLVKNDFPPFHVLLSNSEPFCNRSNSNFTHSRSFLNFTLPRVPQVVPLLETTSQAALCWRYSCVYLAFLRKWTISFFLSSSSGDWYSLLFMVNVG